MINRDEINRLMKGIFLLSQVIYFDLKETMNRLIKNATGENEIDLTNNNINAATRIMRELFFFVALLH